MGNLPHKSKFYYQSWLIPSTGWQKYCIIHLTLQSKKPFNQSFIVRLVVVYEMITLEVSMAISVMMDLSEIDTYLASLWILNISAVQSQDQSWCKKRMYPYSWNPKPVSCYPQIKKAKSCQIARFPLSWGLQVQFIKLSQAKEMTFLLLLITLFTCNSFIPWPVKQFLPIDW